jgi:hypothetical protein
VLQVDLRHRRAGRADQRLGELLAADPVHHRLDRIAPVGIEGAAEVGDGGAGQSRQQPVDEAGRHPSQEEAVLPHHPPAAGHVGAGVDRGHQLGDVAGLVLEVAVHRHHDPPACACDAGVHGRVLPEVALERDHPHPRVALVQLLQQRHRAVGRPIVDEDHLGRDAGLGQRLVDPSHSLVTVACSFRSGITIVTSGACSRLSTVCGAASVAMVKAYRFVRIGTCACALWPGPGVIMPRDARLPDRPLGSTHGGDCNRGLRRHRDRFRSQLPAVAQRRGRDPVGASRPSARDVLDVAIDDRHGPPLHYLAVHASLVLRDDMLGLRLPSALFGILAIALAYGFGRELLGRSGGAVLAVLVATIPEVVHLAQFARGYTAMLAASFGSMWLLLLLVRTRRARYVAPYAVSALLLVAAHPFGLFALASEMVLLVVLGLAPLRRGWRSQRRNLIVLSLALGRGCWRCCCCGVSTRSCSPSTASVRAGRWSTWGRRSSGAVSGTPGPALRTSSCGWRLPLRRWPGW